ncbi:hypothetical protein EV426DRAFT_348522 [Tirmania nivea]|nr:hypothetical protein EV426DRAFT_348522 [Tirmania nivea]
MLPGKVVLYYYMLFLDFSSTCFGWLTVPSRFGKVLLVHLRLSKRQFSLFAYGGGGLVSFIVSSVTANIQQEELSTNTWKGWNYLWLAMVIGGSHVFYLLIPFRLFDLTFYEEGHMWILPRWLQEIHRAGLFRNAGMGKRYWELGHQWWQCWMAV